MRRETAVQQLAEHEKGIEGARGQLGPQGKHRRAATGNEGQSVPLQNLRCHCATMSSFVQRPYKQTSALLLEL